MQGSPRSRMALLFRAYRQAPATPATLEVSLALFDFHGTILIMVDDAIRALRRPERYQLSNDFGHCICIGTDRSSARAAAEGAQPATDPLLFTRQAFHERL